MIQLKEYDTNNGIIICRNIREPNQSFVEVFQNESIVKYTGEDRTAVFETLNTLLQKLYGIPIKEYESAKPGESCSNCKHGDRNIGNPNCVRCFDGDGKGWEHE